MNCVRNLILGALGAALAGSVAGSACAQASASLPTTATTTIFQPIQLAKNTDLSFGTVVRPAAGAGTVTIASADGARSLVGAGALLATGPNAPAGRATFTVTGEGGQTFSITVPASFNMTRVNGPETIVVTLTPTATTGLLDSTLSNTGTANFGVGGSIPVADTTHSGAYSGTFNVIVAYN
jgi:hypothetical protein